MLKRFKGITISYSNFVTILRLIQLDLTSERCKWNTNISKVERLNNLLTEFIANVHQFDDCCVVRLSHQSRKVLWCCMQDYKHDMQEDDDLINFIKAL